MMRTWMSRLLLGLLLIGLIWPSTLGAQPAPLPAQLDFEQAKALMLKHNPSLRAAKAQSTQQTYAAELPTLWPNPSVNVSQDRIGLPGGGTDNQLFFNVGQTIPYPGAMRARERAANHFKTAAEQAYQEEAARAFRDLRTHYLDVVAAEARVEMLRRITEAVRAATRAGDVRYQEGDFSTFSRARLRVALADFEDQRTQAETDAQQARLRLAYYILPDGAASHQQARTLSDFKVQGALEYQPVTIEYDAALNRALSQRGLLNAAQARIDARSQQLRAAQLQRIPSLNLSAGPKYQDTPGGTEWGYTAGLSLQIPLWNTGRTQIRAHRAQHEMATAQAEAARRQVEVHVREAYAEIQSYERRIDRISNDLLTDTDSLLHDARYVYSEGELSLAGLLDAMEATRSAQRLQIDLISGYLRSLYDLEYAIGIGPNDPSPLLPAALFQADATTRH